MSDKNNLTQYLLNQLEMPLLPTESLVIPLAELLPPNPFEKLGEKLVVDLLAYPSSIADLLEQPEELEKGEESNEDDSEENQEAIILAKAINDFYEHPPALGAELFSQGAHKIVQVSHQSTTLHFAARKGDVDEIERLLKAGVPVDSEDHLSSTALHVAAMFGKTAAALFLINHGAFVYDLSYNGLSAFQLAIDKGHYNTAAAMVATGKIDPNKPNFQGENPLKLLFDAFYTKMLSKDIAEQKPDAIKAVHEMLDAIEVLAAHSGKYCLYASKRNDSGQYFKSPITMQLKSQAIYSPTDELRHKILQTAAKIYETDKSEIPFIQAKNLLHAFPTGNDYYLKLAPKEHIIIQANGHFKTSTTKMVMNTLSAYVAKLYEQNANAIKITIFEKLLEIYTHANEFVNTLGTFEASEHYLSLYESGKTILIPSGWDLHFATHFASLPQKVVGVGNSGDRYVTLEPGVNFFKTNDNLNVDFIKNMAMNQSKQQFEYDNMYEYGIIEKVGTLPTSVQKYGSCALKSHLDAIEGMALIEILNLDPNLDLKPHSKALAHQYFEEFNAFLGHHQLAEYQKGQQGLPAVALIDVFHEIHKKQPGQFTQHDQADAKKIIEILTSPHYQTEFKTWLANDSHTQIGHQLKLQFAQYGLDVSEDMHHQHKMTDNEVNEAIVKFKVANEHTQAEAAHAPPSLETHMPVMEFHPAEAF